MTSTRRTRAVLITIGTLALLAVALLAALPWAARTLTIDYLETLGVHARIDDVDVNLFTGRMTLTDAHGETDDGDGFDIGRLTVNLDYAPLLSKQLDFYRIGLRDARIDIHRGADDSLRVAGIPVVDPDSDAARDWDWGVGLQRLRLDALRVVYTQPGVDGGAPIRRELTFNRSGADDVITWKPQDPVPMNADVQIADSHVKFKGEITPFSDHVEGKFSLATEAFALDLVSPLARQGGLKRLKGTIDSDLDVGLDYRHDSGLALTLDGSSTWHNGELEHANALSARSDRAHWQGRIKLQLLRPDSKPGTIATDGTLDVDKLHVAAPDSFTLDHAQTHWQGNADFTLAADRTRITSKGALTGKNTDLVIADAFDFAADKVDWQGDADADIGDVFAHRAQGRFDSRAARLTFGGSTLSVTADTFAFDGRYQQQPGDSGALVVQTQGNAQASALRFNDDKIGAYWAYAGQAKAHNVDIDGANKIGIERIDASDFRLFELDLAGDAQGALLQAGAATAQRFTLTDLLHYGVADFDIDDALIRIARYDGGIRGWTRLAGAGGNDDAGATSTFSAGHLRLGGGSRLRFHDATVAPAASIGLDALQLQLDDLDTRTPERPAHYKLTAKLGEYGHLDSSGDIAPMSADGPDLSLTAAIRSLALPPLSGYMQAAMSRDIARGTFDGDLDLDATNGELDGNLDATLSNFRLAEGDSDVAKAALGISLDTALALVRTDNDVITFSTRILGDITNPQFSIKYLFREALYAGLRTAVTSYYSPIGLLNVAKNKLANIGRALHFDDIRFEAGKRRISDDGRKYLAEVGTTLSKRPGVTLRVCGQAVPADAQAMSLFGGGRIDADNRDQLERLATARAQSVRDYLAARGIDAARLQSCDPQIDTADDARPQVELALAGD